MMMEQSSLPLNQTPMQHVENRTAEGHSSQALEVVTAVVDDCRRVLGADPEKYVELADALEARADLLCSMGEHALARDNYQEGVEVLQRCPNRMKQLGRMHVGLGVAWEGLGDQERAANHWELAMECFERNEPPSLIAVATLANNLAYYKRSKGDIDGAETAFLKALEIFHTHCGPDHEQTATVASNLGSLYHVAGYFESACEMRTLVVEYCQKRLGNSHVDTAQAYYHLALSLVSKGDDENAIQSFEKSIQAFELLGEAYHDQLTAVAEALEVYTKQ